MRKKNSKNIKFYVTNLLLATYVSRGRKEYIPLLKKVIQAKDILSIFGKSLGVEVIPMQLIVVSHRE